MIGLDLTIKDNSLFVRLTNSRRNLDLALDKGLRRGAKEITEFIKYELLEGQLVNPRSRKLQKGIYYTVAGHHLITIRIRGEHATVGKWIDEGLQGTWLITPRGPWRLKFRVMDGPNGGKLISTLKVHHLGIKGRHFMRIAAEKKRRNVLHYVRQEVREALPLKMQGLRS